MQSMEFTTGVAPGGIPLLGHAWQLRNRTLEFLASLPTYGDLVEIRLGWKPVYVPCHPELLRRVLADDRTFDKGGPFFEKIRDIAGNGVATCPHSEHRAQRRRLQPAFRPEKLARYCVTMEKEIADLQKNWRDQHTIDAFSEFYQCTLNSIMKVLFSVDISDDLGRQLRESYEVTLNKAITRVLTPAILQKLPLPGNRRYRDAVQTLTVTVNRIVKEYHAAANEDRYDVLSLLLNLEGEENAALTPAEIKDQFVTLMAAGSENSAATVTWALCLLAQHPDIERRLHAEVDEVLGGRPACWEDIPKLVFVGQVITETLRLYPPTWLLTRTTTTDTEIAGVQLPQGTTLMFSAYPVHHRGDIFDRPETFDPDRWSPECAGNLRREAFAAFGGGPRKCMGDAFGMMQTTIALATVANQWRLSLEPDADLRNAPGATILRPRRPTMRLSQRTPNGCRVK